MNATPNIRREHDVRAPWNEWNRLATNVDRDSVEDWRKRHSHVEYSKQPWRGYHTVPPPSILLVESTTSTSTPCQASLTSHHVPLFNPVCQQRIGPHGAPPFQRIDGTLLMPLLPPLYITRLLVPTVPCDRDFVRGVLPAAPTRL
jgi:hypothetical protein